MTEPHKLAYAATTLREGHSRYAIASIAIALAVILFSLGVVVWDDPFQSMGNERPLRIATAAGFLGMFLALRALCDPNRELILAKTGLVLNVLAILGAWVFVPYIWADPASATPATKMRFRSVAAGRRPRSFRASADLATIARDRVTRRMTSLLSFIRRGRR